jgi:4-aminobutyrate aminotransferase/(S)-3-amino-2-methylpropionate transaminase
MLIRAGLFSNCIRFLPPLNTPEDMLREALNVVGDAIEATVAAEQMQAAPLAAPR